MHSIDYTILIIYLAGIFLLGLILSGKNKSSADMFSASGESPWWTSGLSAFMTMFSAGTFVVWGGIAYKYGLVAVTINLCYGVAALAVGYTLAGRWKKLGVKTPSEFIHLRFGSGAVKFYTWSMMLVNIISAGVALYALSKILVALMPMAEGSMFTDGTGHFSIHWAILIAGTVIIIYTMMGGLWAVLMTDVLQFIILNMAVLFVIPLIWNQAGGYSGFMENAPAGFLKFTEENKFTWFFMGGWILIHFFKIGAEWAFAQRFICVPSEKDAKKSTYLFGALYLISPLFWLLPPMVYRTINPNVEPEQAYILACQAVLPVGMLGLMVAAMFSATASMVSSQLNVFAGVFTEMIYGNRLNPSETSQLKAGRFFTAVLGIFLTGIALAVPYLGGAEQVILSVTKLMVGPLLAPTVWGLVSKRVTTKAVWLTAGISFVVGVILKLIMQKEGTTVDISIGVILPVAILTVMHYIENRTSSGWQQVLNHQTTAEYPSNDKKQASSLPALIVSICIIICGFMMFALIPFNDSQSVSLLSVFGGSLILISIVIFTFYKRKQTT